jgi:hypothetical protein
MTDIETQGTKTDKGWRDRDGFVGPFQPGVGPRTDPKGEFSTGPEMGQPMPDVQCETADEILLDLHAHRAGRPALFIFYRSAVW